MKWIPKKRAQKFFLYSFGLLSSLSHMMMCFAENTITLSLDQAMEMAESHSFAARIAEQSQIVSEKNESAFFRRLFPSVGASANYSKYDPSVNKATGTSSAQNVGAPGEVIAFSGNVKLTQQVVGIYPLLLAVQQASAQSRAAQYSTEQSRNEARFKGASAYINAQKASKLLEVASSSVDVAEKQLHDAEAQYNAGKLTNADVLKFKLNLENSKTTLIQAQTTYKVAFLSLSETIGMQDTSSFSLPQDEHIVKDKQRPQLPEVKESVSYALSHRHDLRAANENINAAHYNTLFTLGSYLPDLNFVTTYSRNFRQKDMSGFQKDDLRDQLVFGFEFSWNIWDWGIRQAQYQSAKANEHSSQLSMEDIQSQIKINASQSYFRLLDAVQVLDSAKASVQYAEDAYAQTKAQFINGQVTSTDLISSSTDQTTAQANYANAVGDLDLAWCDYQRSIGVKLSSNHETTSSNP